MGKISMLQLCFFIFRLQSEFAHDTKNMMDEEKTALEWTAILEFDDSTIWSKREGLLTRNEYMKVFYHVANDILLRSATYDNKNTYTIEEWQNIIGMGRFIPQIHNVP